MVRGLWGSASSASAGRKSLYKVPQTSPDLQVAPAAAAALQTATFVRRGHSRPATCSHKPRPGARPSPPAASASASRRENSCVIPGFCRVLVRPSSCTQVLQKGTRSMQADVTSSAPPALRSQSAVSLGKSQLCRCKGEVRAEERRPSRAAWSGRVLETLPGSLGWKPTF